MRLAIASIALAALMCGGSALGADTAPAGSAERGMKQYVDNGCFACHGTEGQGGGRGSGPKISRPLMPWDAFRDLVRRPPRNMPAYSQKVMSDGEVADMYAYLASLKPSPAAKDIPLLNQM
jgi:mono/diheme cytochrome c family protein